MDDIDRRNTYPADEVKAAWQALLDNEKEYKANRAEFANRVLAFGKHLLAARETYRNAATGAYDDTGFGQWLKENEIDLDADTRAAYIYLARHEEVTRSIIEDTELRSIRGIYKQVKHNVGVDELEIPDNDIIKPGNPKDDYEGMTREEMNAITEELQRFADCLDSVPLNEYVAELDGYVGGNIDKEELRASVSEIRHFANRLTSKLGTDEPDPCVDPLSAIISLENLWTTVSAFETWVSSLDDEQRARFVTPDTVLALREIAKVLDPTGDKETVC